MPSSASIEIPVPAHLPADYVARDDVRMEAYRRLAAVTEPADVDDVRAPTLPQVHGVGVPGLERRCHAHRHRPPRPLEERFRGRRAVPEPAVLGLGDRLGPGHRGVSVDHLVLLVEGDHARESAGRRRWGRQCLIITCFSSV